MLRDMCLVQLRQLVVLAELLDRLELSLAEQALERDWVAVRELGVVESRDRRRRGARRGRNGARRAGDRLFARSRSYAAVGDGMGEGEKRDDWVNLDSEAQDERARASTV